MPSDPRLVVCWKSIQRGHRIPGGLEHLVLNGRGADSQLIAFDDEGIYRVLFNPEIVKKSGPYEAEEGCLSLTGTRKTKRWKSIKVKYQDEQFRQRFKTWNGWPAQIIQHEIDHCEGIII